MNSFPPACARILLLASVLPLSVLSAAPVLRATRTSLPPRLDGKLDEACWQQAEAVSEFLINNTTQPAAYSTAVSVLYDDTAIYFGVTCHDPDISGLLTRKLPRDHHDVFRTDCIELMIDPACSRNDYYHIGINASGSVADRACTQGGFIGDMSWDAEVDVGTVTGDSFWACEVRIPFFCLGITPRVGPTWRLNVCREKRRPAENSSIADNGAFNIAGSFAELRGIEVDFSRYCFIIGAPSTDNMEVKANTLELDVHVPVRNATGRAADVLLDCWLIPPSREPAVASRPAVLAGAAEARQHVGHFSLREQGQYDCCVRVADAATKTPLAFRRARLDIEYIPMAIDLIEPWYRHAIFETQNLRQVVLDVEIRLDPSQLESATLLVDIRPHGRTEAVVSTRIARPTRRNRATFSVASLPYGRLDIGARLSDAQGRELATTSHPLRKLNRKQGEVWLGKDMQWRVDGKPFFLNAAWNYTEDFNPHYNAFTADVSEDVKLISCAPMNVPRALRERLREKTLDPELAERFRTLVRGLKDKPNLFGYYLCDEPECLNATASALEQAYQVICDADPHHPIIISNDSMSGLRDYARCADINGLHPYPPILRDKRVNDLSAVASFMEASAAFFRTAAQKQTVAYLHQGFNYGDYGAVNNRIPTYVEYRNQNLLAAICGANGFLQFNRMVDHYPELRIGMPHLTKELGYLGSFLLAATPDLAPSADSPKVKMLLKRGDGESYLFACNADSEPRKVSISVPGLKADTRRLHVISERRTVALADDRFSDQFDAWEAHVYTTAAAAPDLLTVPEICSRIEAANRQRRKPGNLAYQQFEGDGVLVSASSNVAGKYRRSDAGLWHVVDGLVDTKDRYHSLTWHDTTPNQGPDWLEIELPDPHPVGRVVVHPFDTSLRDYAVQGFVREQWRDLDAVTGKNASAITHTFAPVSTKRIRLWVTATNGPVARVTEVEVYEQ